MQKRQQQRLQQQQQHQHHRQNNPEQDTEASNEDQGEAGYASANSPRSVAQDDDAIVGFSTAPASHQTEYVEESPGEIPQHVQFQEAQGRSSSYQQHQQYNAQAKWHKPYRQGSEPYSPQSFTPPNVQQQQQQHLEFVSLAMESHRIQTQFVVNQTQPFVERAGTEQTEIAMPQEYQYVQQAQAPVQTYPVYQMRPAQIPQQQAIAAQQTVARPVVASPIVTTQVSFRCLLFRKYRGLVLLLCLLFSLCHCAF